MEKKEKSPVYQHEVIEFVTVAVQYCAYLEQAESKQRHEFVDTILKVLPLLYLKGALLPQYEILTDYNPSDYVTEENYDIIRNNIAFILGEKDDYLDVFMEDMKYSETPILTTISENLADIYQDLKNFVSEFKDGNEDNMMGALSVCKDNFKNYWGQKLTNVMRALHEVCYSDLEDDELLFEE
ncbi:MAG: DUF5063 domain-containing protein [Bacteroidaceae bacterium]|nr:DUF5063 domain-containing protein [Bacteroidaceae bacterium]